MATDNVEFYERMQKLQVLQQQREQQRMGLEKELNTYLKSDKRLNRVHANKLQSYWNKICEDERHSRARNEQLLQDYHRVETHVAALSARTDRLKLLKDQYDKQVELMYPRWQEQVELKRRQQLLQQQKEQQQLAHQLQQAQQQQQQQQQYLQGQQQQAAQQQRENYLPQRQGPSEPQKQRQDVVMHQQQKDQVSFPMQQQQQQHQNLQHLQQQPQQQYLSTQEALNLNNDDYNHLRRTNPLIPNIHVQPNTPPILASGDPRYTSIQFGTQPSSLSYGIPSAGQGGVTNLQVAQDTGSYQIPSAGSTFGTNQPQMSYGQQGSSGGSNVGATVEGLHAPLTDPDAGYTRLQDRRQGLETYPSSRHPDDSSPVYADVRPEGIPGLQISSTRLPQPQGDPGTLQVQTAPAAIPQRNEVLNADIPRAANSHIRQEAADEAQASRGSGGITASKAYPVPQPVKKTVILAQDDDEDDDSIVTPLDEEDPYLMPEKLHPKSSTAPKPAERAGSSVSAKAVSTARTDPFTSEDEDEEEDVSEKEALRDALQNQLQLGDDGAPERKQTGPPLNNKQMQMEPKGEQLEKNRIDIVSGKSEAPDDKQKEQSATIETPNDEGGEEEEEEEEEEESDSEDEIGSDMSLPLSDTGAAERPGMTGPRTDKNKPSVGYEKAQQASLQPQVASVMVTEQGFWNLVSAVELEIDQSDNIEKIYNLPDCTTAIKTEIVRTANSNSSLEHLNPNAISMVVLDQLPKLVQQLPGGCLLSDKVLDSQRTITEVTIRSFLYSAALSFWDKLLQHLVQLIRKGVMDAEDVSTIVAPLLINPGSAWADKAVDVLMSIFQDIEQQEESQLEDTYSSMPSASATPSHLSIPRHDQPGAQGPVVPPLNLGETINQETPDLETDRVSHDSFFDEPAVPLTETKAYQQMMQSSQGHQARPTSQEAKGGGEEVDEEDGDVISSTDDEEDNEIERATRLSPETPPSSRNKKRRNVLSSLGGSGSLGITYGNSDDDDDEAGSQGGGGDTKRSEQMSDLISSPSPSPSPKGSGYVPSAMEQSMKSTGRSDPMQRSAAFWGEESDMEESEMSVPMGTGTLKSDDFKDEFDFYD